MGTAVQGLEQGGCGCPELGENLRGVDSDCHDVQFRDVCDETTHWECFGRIPSQGGPQADGTTTLERARRWIFVSSAGVIDGGDGITGGGDIHIPPYEHSSTVHCNQAHYGPVSGGGAASRVKGVQYVVETGRLVLVWDADSVLGWGTDRVGVGDGWDCDRDGINR